MKTKKVTVSVPEVGDQVWASEDKTGYAATVLACVTWQNQDWVVWALTPSTPSTDILVPQIQPAPMVQLTPAEQFATQFKYYE